MLSHLRPAIVMIVLFTALTGLAYPLAITGVAQLMFHDKANGSVVERDGKVVGSSLIGQNFASDQLFPWPPLGDQYTRPGKFHEDDRRAL